MFPDDTWQVMTEEDFEAMRIKSQSQISKRGDLEIVEFDQGKRVLIFSDPVLGKSFFTRGEIT